MSVTMPSQVAETKGHIETSEIRGVRPNAHTKMLRVSVDISPQFNDRLSHLSDKLCVSKAEFLKRAFLLLDATVEATEDKSKKFGIANKDQTLETEFIGLW